ncbi:type IV secretion system DNA-binding domain-containing protein [bacterium]|jgi:hypothetical protein|nr:type IV secretion system DNA-binding domain-containing protein [bacterium]
MSNINYIAKINFRKDQRWFGIKQVDRLFHTYIIGKTGTGKTTLLFQKMIQDIETGLGLALIDPHGDLADKIIREIPERRKKDLVFLDAVNKKCLFGYNPLKRIRKSKRSLAASGIIETLRKLYDAKSWGVKMEHILRNVLLTLLDQEQADLSCIPRILLDKQYRNSCLNNIQNNAVINFWQDEYAHYNPFQKANAIAPILNKIGAFLSNPYLSNVLISERKQISFRSSMDQKKIIIIKLPKGSIGEDASMLLGGLLINSIALAAFSRSDIAEDKRKPFMVYVDEFQLFTTSSIANMLSELRKYRVGMILANQFLSQLEKEIRDSVLGNVGTIISFRLGVSDAKYMANEFYPVFEFSNIVSLANYHIYLKLMIDGTPSKPFSAETQVVSKNYKKYKKETR